MADKQVTFTRESLVRFKRAYATCETVRQDVFVFEGNEYLMGYAKHLIAYLDGVFAGYYSPPSVEATALDTAPKPLV